LIAGSREFQEGHCQVKDLRSGQSETCPLADNAQAVVAAVQRILAG